MFLAECILRSMRNKIERTWTKPATCSILRRPGGKRLIQAGPEGLKTFPDIPHRGLKESAVLHQLLPHPGGDAGRLDLIFKTQARCKPSPRAGP
jgi:hypothetical protein